MYLKRLELKNFRNYQDLDLNFSDNINIIHGENAQGKTNLLESIYFLAITKSHRSFIDNNLIKNDKNFFKIKAELVTKNFTKQFELMFNEKNKKFIIDKKEIKVTSDYLSNINVIIFYPEDLDIIKNSPNIRRRYLDIEIGQLDKKYLKVLSEYNKLLKIRNDMLKSNLKNNDLNINYLYSIDEHLVDRASKIHHMRNKFITKINEILPDIYKNITSTDKIYLNYIPSDNILMGDIEIKEKFHKLLELKRSNDIKIGRTSVGPHLDDFNFIYMEKDLKYFGSQGQQRAAVLSLKLSEIKIFKNHTGETPILLLDDVFSELDENKRNNLLKYINKDVQTIITTTDINLVSKELLQKSNIIKIKNGQIQKREGDQNGK